MDKTCLIPRISSIQRKGLKTKLDSSLETWSSQLDEDIIGSEAGFWGPLGWTKYTYLDHTASGKSLKCIETFIQSEVLPHYANTHTTVSFTSLQTTRMRAEARKLIKESVGASEVDDEVIFCGSGATAAIHKLLHLISYPKTRKFIVLVGPFEHHSNILPWRETATKVIHLRMDPSTGQIDIPYLLGKLKGLRIKYKLYSYATKPLIVGCFSAGSNITGVLTDDVEITQIMHEFGGLAVWDYAAAAPHVNINMNPQNRMGNSFKDAIFFSGHKFLGGPQTPGVLVVKKHLLRNPVPHGVGGGTVLFTTRRGHQYLQEITEKEEGGTPDIIGSIRLGLVFRFRNLVGIQNIIEREATLCRKALKAWRDIPEICILGSATDIRLPIISFMIRHRSSGYFLHHNFVVALLNDLFGIQCRGGCMCAGPYAQLLLGIDDKLAGSYAEQLKRAERDGHSKLGAILKPGFTRISLSFHTTPEELAFVIEAVKLIALYGWKLLPYYKISWESSTFLLCSHPSLNLSLQVRTLAAFDKRIHSQLPLNKDSSFDIDDNAKFNYASCLKRAKKVIKNSSDGMLPIDIDYFQLLQNNSHYPKELDTKLRWFMMPYEAAPILFDEYGHFPGPSGSIHGSSTIKSSEPFKLYVGSLYHHHHHPSWKIGSIPHSISNSWSKFPNHLSEGDINSTKGKGEMTYQWEELWKQIEIRNMRRDEESE